MGVTLSIEIISPLEPDDRELLTGLSIMVMAIANHELAKEHFPGAFDTEEEPEPMPCMSAGHGADEGKYCVSEVAHKGRHKFRFILPPTEGLN